MTTETGSPAGGEAIFSTPLPADAPETFSSPTEAAAYFTALKEKKQPAESAEEATAENELSEEDNGDPETAPAEAPDEAEPAEQPPIEPPRAWSKEEKEAFLKLPRDAQEISARIASVRETEFRRAQNELAEQRKAIEAARQQAEQAKQQYLEKIPTIEDIQRFVQQGPFADIKTQDDADALAQNDPFRYLQWDAYQKRLSGVAIQATQAQALKAQEKQSRRAAYEAEQNARLVELVPDMADPKKAGELRESAVKMLTSDLGMNIDQLSRWMSDDVGHEILSNAGIQKLIADRLAFQALKAAPKAIAAKPLPPVQRPGTSRPAGSDASEREQALNRKPELSVKEATELYELQSRRRRA